MDGKSGRLMLIVKMERPKDEGKSGWRSKGHGTQTGEGKQNSPAVTGILFADLLKVLTRKERISIHSSSRAKSKSHRTDSDV